MLRRPALQFHPRALRFPRLRPLQFSATVIQAVQADALFSAGARFFSPQLVAAASAAQGRWPLAVPSFVNTFSPPISSFEPASSSSTPPPFSAPVPSSSLSSASPLPAFQQPFVVGPGFSQVPAKLVSQIVSGKFVDLCDLLSANLLQNEPEPQLSLDGRVVLTTTPRHNNRHVESWMEAFSIYSVILASHFPHHWRDLSQYKLLILRTYRQFSGKVWLVYDRALCEHAAATRLTDWSTMNSQLFNFHSAGAAARNPNESVSSTASEPRGSLTCQVVCQSWNN